MLSFSASTLGAQSADDTLRGTWQIDAPDNTGLVVIIKREGRASYFSTNTPDRSVNKGTWRSVENGAVINWSDGSSLQLTQESLGFTATYNNSRGQGQYTAPAQRVPKDVLGQWAKPPKSENENESDRDQAKGFFGIWKIDLPTETVFFTIEPDRSAASTFGYKLSKNRGLRGEWAKQGSELHIAWDSGHYSILREGERGFTYKRVEPGVVIESDTTELIPASRTLRASLPGQWQDLYAAERENYTGGVAFSSRKNALSFYRGDWLIQVTETAYEKIDIGRFGGLSTSRSKNLGGDWLMTGQDIFMRWDDGIRKILSPVGLGFIVYEFQPGRPLDGVPTRISPALPANPVKLEKYLVDREDVANHLLAMATAAGVEPGKTQTGWGNTFMRWAWPFSDNDYAMNTNIILEESTTDKSFSDPWWWPFWSETRPANAALAETTVTDTEAKELPEQTQEEPVASTNAPNNPEGKQTKTATKKKAWYWPY